MEGGVRKHAGPTSTGQDRLGRANPGGEESQ